MKRSAAIGTALLSLILNATAQAHSVGHKLDDATCGEAWAKASPDGSAISNGQADPYLFDAEIVDMDGDGLISLDEFKTACLDGYMRSPAEIAQAMERSQAPIVNDSIEKQYARMLGAWDAAGPEARKRFQEYIDKK